MPLTVTYSRALASAKIPKLHPSTSISIQMNAIYVMRPNITDMSVEAAESALRGEREEWLHREPKFGGG